MSDFVERAMRRLTELGAQDPAPHPASVELAGKTLAAMYRAVIDAGLEWQDPEISLTDAVELGEGIRLAPSVLADWQDGTNRLKLAFPQPISAAAIANTRVTVDFDYGETQERRTQLLGDDINVLALWRAWMERI